MRELQNVLYVTTQGTALSLEGDAVRIRRDGEFLTRLPLLNLASIVVIGRVSVSPFLIQRCADDGRPIVWLDRRGRFKGRLQGRTKGNVLLRRAQHLALSDHPRVESIARQVVAGKIQNSRQILLRGSRDVPGEQGQEARSAAVELEGSLERLEAASDLDQIRGIEGESARRYFASLPSLIRQDAGHWCRGGRSRRPPRDPLNAVLSFLYAMLRAECESALEGVGLDPQVGYLHALRPGRPALALDLMEELRPLVDRLALTLINRGQLKLADFEELPGGAIRLTEPSRRTVIEGYQRRKEVELVHRALGRHVPFGLVPHVQARLMARQLRDDLKVYPPFIYR